MSFSSFRRAFFRTKAILATFSLIISCLALWAFVIEPNRLVVTEATIVLPGLPAEFEGMRIAAISDLHVGSNFITLDKLHQVVERTNATGPDVIVLLGDFVQNTQSHTTENGNHIRVSGSVMTAPEVFAQPLKSFRAKLGVYAVLGNHDRAYDEARIRSSLEAVGIRFLDNDAVRLERGNVHIWLAGLGDHFTQNHDVAKTLRAITDDAPVIAITHSPDLFPELPARFRLTLAGHTHGGQVNLPLLGRLIVPSKYGARYAAGRIEEAGKHLFVTTGIGTSILPVRFRVPPEIALITLSSEKNGR
jgi:uncharacterized protein